jgi:hydrogenase maturation protease
MATTLIIGYGNSTRGDDGIGRVAAERLAEEMSNPDVRILACQQLALELAPELSQVDRVILIDAVRDGAAGRVRVERIEPTVLAPEPFSHQLDPAVLVECTRTLYGRCPETWLVSVAGESFGFSDQLSASVAAAWPVVLTRVRELVEGQVQSSFTSPANQVRL